MQPTRTPATIVILGLLYIITLSGAQQFCPCQNGGTCRCFDGDPCLCQNGASCALCGANCTSVNPDFVCICQPGITGQFCENVLQFSLTTDIIRDITTSRVDITDNLDDSATYDNTVTVLIGALVGFLVLCSIIGIAVTAYCCTRKKKERMLIPIAQNVPNRSNGRAADYEQPGSQYDHVYDQANDDYPPYIEIHPENLPTNTSQNGDRNTEVYHHYLELPNEGGGHVTSSKSKADPDYHPYFELSDDTNSVKVDKKDEEINKVLDKSPDDTQTADNQTVVSHVKKDNASKISQRQPMAVPKQEGIHLEYSYVDPTNWTKYYIEQ